ncbi:MAG: Rpn family recombination-promoting nuclease/putative transposase [Bacteroidia bacterium]
MDTRYVDPRLKEYFSDLVYTCLTREDVPVWISFLFEHKSYPVRVSPFADSRRAARIGESGRRVYLFYTIFVYLLNGSKINFEKVMKSMYNLIPEEWVEMYEDSPAMELIRRGREETRAEAEAKLAEAEREIAAARYSAAIEAREKAEAERKETEARRKEAEARQQAREKSREKAVAIKKAIATQKKAEAEKRFAIKKMLEAGIEKSSIATFLGLSRQKLAAYIRQLDKE